MDSAITGGSAISDSDHECIPYITTAFIALLRHMEKDADKNTRQAQCNVFSTYTYYSKFLHVIMEDNPTL